MRKFLLSILVVLVLAVTSYAFDFGLNLNFAGGRDSLFFERA